MLPIKTILFYPTILIHGIGGDSSDLQDLKVNLEDKGVEVYNIEIGNGKLDSIIWNINKQCEVFSENINNLSIESKKINIIGVSQGGLLARCYVEKYSSYIKPVNSLITYGTPHMGVYIPWINLKRLEYWKDPYNYHEYLNNNDFLVYINNEKTHTDVKLYRDNMLSLNNFLVVWSDLEKVVKPKESTKFEFFNTTFANITGELKIIDFQKSEQFTEDKIGLQELYKNNKLLLKQFDCLHEEFKHPKCFSKNFTNQKTTLLHLTLSLL
tara:strand:+ start:94 stop:897 length:804 start_codon:yes stop_codon:yes gene_type:complete